MPTASELFIEEAFFPGRRERLARMAGRFEERERLIQQGRDNMASKATDKFRHAFVPSGGDAQARQTEAMEYIAAQLYEIKHHSRKVAEALDQLNRKTKG